ncbi:TPA: hypothetical protein CPT81_06400 [Candidatus Gastranaerophilales bacterium HUM_20]|nr:unknown [Clostridium sp. CAG:729]DAB20623.1 MAG TPA: hypothetical protein CPT81_06400 [Candidatus Gastranaerophilales bacterium HUM_20]
MGMAAGQARLLSITARLTNNENTGQSVSYSKQRLADQTQQITNEYNEALEATKLTVLTGFNGAEANYTDISYNLMTGLQMADSTKQYIVTDAKGKILVTNDIAKAYEKSNGNYNMFLANLTGATTSKGGKAYSQADITVSKANEKWVKLDADGKPVEAAAGEAGAYDNNSDTVAAKQKIHDAWDKYFSTVGINLGDNEHDFGFSWTETYTLDEDGNKVYSIGDGYAGYARTDENGDYIKDASGNIIYDPINYEGTTDEQRELYDYAMALTEAYLRVNTGDETVPFKVEYNADNYNTAANAENKTDFTYYKNIFNKMQSSGYFTYTNKPGEADENHIYADVGTGTAGNVQKSPLADNVAFEEALRNGTLRLEYYSTTDRAFKSTTISDDSCIQEVADERAIARAESKYTQDMTDLENKDKKLDLELKRLDTEHSALQTEYDSVKSVVDKNVESSFKIFS